MLVSTPVYYKNGEKKKGKKKREKRLWWSTMKQMQVQLWPLWPPRADRLSFADARYCISLLKSSVTSRSSQRGNQKCWNNLRSSYTSSGFMQSWNLWSLQIGSCTCTEPVFWQPSWILSQTARVCNQQQANTSIEQLTSGGRCYKLWLWLVCR